MLWPLLLSALSRLPQGLLSRVTGALADIKLPRPMRPLVLRTFARIAGIRVDEAEFDVRAYPSVNAFFVRRLRAGLRDFGSDPRAVVSPVDGIVGAFGAIEDDTALQAKGLPYKVDELLGEAATPWRDGHFITIYLAPRHYHRIHTPMPARVVRARHVPGRLFPVNAPAVAHVPRLFAINERLIAILDTAAGPLGLAAVGAFNVGRISAAFDRAWGGRDGDAITNRGQHPPPERLYDPPIELGAGAELMAFHLGSTVVLVLPAGLTPVSDLTTGMEIQAGRVLAR